MNNNKVSKYVGGSSLLSPFSSRFPTELDNMFSSLFDEFWNEPSFVTSRNWKPTNFREDEQNIYIEIELPRYKKENIKLEVVNSSLKISAETENTGYVRTFNDSRIDYNSTPEAKLEDGVLTITAKKREELKPKQIEIK